MGLGGAYPKRGGASLTHVWLRTELDNKRNPPAGNVVMEPVRATRLAPALQGPAKGCAKRIKHQVSRLPPPNCQQARGKDEAASARAPAEILLVFPTSQRLARGLRHLTGTGRLYFLLDSPNLSARLLTPRRVRRADGDAVVSTKKAQIYPGERERPGHAQPLWLKKAPATQTATRDETSARRKNNQRKNTHINEDIKF